CVYRSSRRQDGTDKTPGRSARQSGHERGGRLAPELPPCLAEALAFAEAEGGSWPHLKDERFTDGAGEGAVAHAIVPVIFTGVVCGDALQSWLIDDADRL